MAKLSEVEGLDEALAQARATAHAEGRREGYMAGRADAAAIMALDGAANCPALAAELAGDAAISKESAGKLIAAAPKASGAADYRAKLTAASPDVGPNPTPADDEVTRRASRVEQLSSIAKLATSARR